MSKRGESKKTIQAELGLILSPPMNATLESPAEEAIAEEQPKQPVSTSRRPPPSKVLPTDRISWPSQVELVRAFAAIYTSTGQPVTNESAGQTITNKLSGSTVSQGTAFFREIKLIQPDPADKPVGFKPCKELIEYNDACQWDPTEAGKKLRPVIEATWFYKALVPRLQIAAQPINSCLLVLAQEAKASKDHDEKLKNLLKVLELAGIVSIAANVVSLTQSTPEKIPPAVPEAKQKVNLPDDQEQHTLFLDKERKRRVVLSGPLEISAAEYKRVCKWIKVTLIVEGADQAEDEDKT